MYDYSKLIGKIYEKHGSKKNFALAIEMSPTLLVGKISGAREWRQSEMAKAMKAIDEPMAMVGEYFFTPKV